MFQFNHLQSEEEGLSNHANTHKAHNGPFIAIVKHLESEWDSKADEVNGCELVEINFSFGFVL